MKLSVSLLLTSLLSSSVMGESPVLAVHGSGTTNPSKCYWHIMDQMMDGAKEPLHLTYRAVGSSTGILDFVGDLVNETMVPRNDFGSGDVPIPTDDYNLLTNQFGIELLQLPVVLGAISFFHSVPNVPDLELTSCLLARIMSRDIKTWTHPDIVNLNPNIRELIGSDLAITVGRRNLGSSSTASITQYLHTTCDASWPKASVGKEITWAEGTKICEGSGGMTTCIRDTPGTIGYIDAGHGHSENLVEIELQNADGNFISSKEVGTAGIGAAAANANLPDRADQDFGAVELLNQPGPNTWPIVAMSYVYVRKDLAHIPDPADRALLLAFLTALYEDEFIGACTELFGFAPVPETVRELAFDGIGMLGQTEGPTFEFESSSTTNKVDGQRDYFISGKRRSYGEYERSSNAGAVEDIMNENLFLKSQLTLLNEKIDLLDSEVETVKSNNLAALNSMESSNKGLSFTENDDSQIMAALVMASLSIVLWGVVALGAVYRMFCASKA